MPNSAPFVYVLVLNFNGIAFNDTCLESLSKSDYPNFKILLVDNGSTDDSVERARKTYPTIEILENKKNLLFAAGNNRGMEIALQKNAEYIFILNNDTKIAPSCLKYLVSFMANHPKAGAVQPLLCRMDDSTQIASAGCRISLSGRAWDDAFGKLSKSVGREPCQIPAVTGGAMLVRTDVIRQIGVFDENFGMYFEDVDLSFRIYKKGFNLYLVPTAKVWHIISASTGSNKNVRHIQFSEANSYRILVKHFPFFLLLVSLPLSLIVTFGITVKAILSGQRAYAWAAVQGGLEGISVIMPALIKRIISQGNQSRSIMRCIDWKILYPPKGLR